MWVIYILIAEAVAIVATVLWAIWSAKQVAKQDERGK